jgi:membrane protein DedA with SNARE-associated domain
MVQMLRVRAAHGNRRRRGPGCATSEGVKIEDFVQACLAFIRDHQAWLTPIVFVLSFGESLAFLSLLLPATAILFAVGGLIGASGLDVVPIWAAAAFGAFLGDWVSYWFGWHYRDRVGHMWPLSRHPQMLERGHRFFERWGIAGVFFGRFFGPLRAAVPLAAGICGMPQRHFQIANVASALVWAAGILAPGVLGMGWFMG